MKVYKNSTFLIFISVALLMAGCSGVKGLFSKGQDELKKASAAFSNGDELQALIHATQSIIVDPEFYQGKAFIYEKFDKSVEKAALRIAVLKNPATPAEAEEKYVLLGKMIQIYDNLKQIKMPLSQPKGKWRWETKIVDYTQDREISRKQTFDLFMKEGRNALAANMVKESEAAFSRAAKEFCANDAEKKDVSQKIADEICTRAASHLSSNKTDDIILANSFYKSALKFVTGHPAATAGISSSATKAASIFHAQGQALENSRDIEKMIASVDEYKKAIHWEGKNKTYTDALSRVTTSIAEYYYAAGSVAEKAKDLPKAIAQYGNARKWIPDYKDAMTRIYNLRIGGKIDELAKNLAATKVEHGKFQSRINTVSGVVDTSNDVMGKITYVSDKSRSLNNIMNSTSRTLKAFAIIPVVGTTTNILAKSIDISQNPVGVVAGKFDAIESPVITPVKTAVEQTKAVVDNVKAKMGTTGTAVQTAETYTLKLKDCISKVAVEKNFQEAEAAIDELNKGLVEVNKTMNDMDGRLVKVETQGKKIVSMAGSVGKVTNGLQSVTNAVDKVMPVVNELNSVLDKEFGVMSYKFSARKILEGVSGPAKWVMNKLSDLVMSALKPVLKKFSIEIPSVPGISDLARQLDQFNEIQAGLQAEVSGIKQKAVEYVKYQETITNNLTKLQKSVGCETLPVQ